MSDPFARVVLASVSDQGIPLVTLHLRYWRGIHSELMTHRVFSRNARSSRAVPVARMLEEIRNDPFVPRHWGANQKGMQASEECNEPIRLLANAMDDEINPISREEAWLEARDNAVYFAEGFSNAGYHKQVANRLLEPFMWIDTLVSSTDWANFFALRDHKDAEPHFRDLAQLTKEAIRYANFQSLTPDHWHLPYITPDDKKLIEDRVDRLWGHPEEVYFHRIDLARKISAARCARISYAPFDGDGSIDKELERFKLLVENWPVHASPVEHQATPDTYTEGYKGPYGEWRVGGSQNSHQHRNFRGWRQFRSMIKGETVSDKDNGLLQMVSS